MQGKKLKELDLKNGDKFKFTGSEIINTYNGNFIGFRADTPQWHIVSRASDTPKLWLDMTPDEKGALLLAHHEGKVIECWQRPNYGWLSLDCDPQWGDQDAYRVKPKPKRETVSLFVKNNDEEDKNIGTIDMIDGKPDTASIKIKTID